MTSTNPANGEHFARPGLRVRVAYDPSISGVTTGEIIRRQGRDYIAILLNTGDLKYLPSSHLELAPEKERRGDAVDAWRFAGPEAVLRQTLGYKIQGTLTDVFYSMGSGIAEFYPHQFKPVLKFVSSTTGRLLVADEVGLGKTIEALYIWRELQARVGARRLLIVCPAALRTKWKEELRRRFSLDSEIADAKRLLALCDEASQDPARAFVAIAGIESIRARLKQNEATPTNPSPRQALLQFLTDNETRADSSLLDLVVIDEAHILRNPETANHHTAAALADAANHLVLLTATPIQIGSENLFRLLSFIDAERFPTIESFEQVQRANRPVMRALSALLDTPPRQNDFREALLELKTQFLFRNDNTADELLSDGTVFTSDERRIYAARALESRSLTSDVLTRTRKRDVIENRVVRASQVVRVTLNSEELALYDQVTSSIRQRANGSSTSTAFALISRQRQLASSIPAAIAGWRESGVLDEILWEDLGIEPDDDVDMAAVEFAPLITKTDFAANDTKYRELKKILDGIGRGGGKVVLFSFYRGTLSYLERRLRADGFSCSRIVGGMGDAKDAELKRFEDPKGAQILLSSEVGAEGIDLQFARIVVNYDLPWNPMKVEQRIGRIDRLGQEADRIQIVSFVLKDTIEEIVLDRLHQRINVFEQSIGDLEEILGESVDEILLQYFREGLTEAEISKRLELNALAAQRRRDDEATLEQEAPDLIGHTDYLLRNIERSREAGHWIRPEDTLSYVVDFLQRNYVGSKVEQDTKSPGIYLVDLSPDARAALQSFIDDTRPAKATRMHVPAVVVRAVFEPGTVEKGRIRPELVDITHPIVLWARDQIQRAGQQSELSAAIHVRPDRVSSISPDLYVWASDLWRFEGLRKDVRLRHLVVSATTDTILTQSDADRLLDHAMRFGDKLDIARLHEQADGLKQAFHSCEHSLRDAFLDEQHAFTLENEFKTGQAIELLEQRTRRKLAILKDRLDSQRRSDDQRRRRMAPATEGLIKKAKADFEQRKARIQTARKASVSHRPIAGGFILVGEAF